MDALDAGIAGNARASQMKDLWPDDADLRDGSVEVFDKSGRKVADLRITGPELERWLQLADVAPAPAPTPPPGANDK
jgi:hypothetical protein